MDENNMSSVSKANTLEAMGEFWDEHDFIEFDDPNLPDVAFSIASTISIEPDLLSAVEKQARQRGVAVETLINLWLQEKLTEQNQMVTT